MTQGESRRRAALAGFRRWLKTPLVLAAVATVAALVALLFWRPWKERRRPGPAAPPSAEKTVIHLPAADSTPTLAPPLRSVTNPPIWTNSIGMQFTLIPAGDFTMGAPEYEVGPGSFEQLHHVRITKSFYLGTYSVTRGQFAKFAAAADFKGGKGGIGFTGNPKVPYDWRLDFTWRTPGFHQTDDHPVVEVSWHDATAFCDWLSSQEGKKYRLPTEAEWEYACRAGTTTTYFFGDNAEDLVKYANLSDATLKEQFPAATTIAASDGYAFTAPMGSFRPNRFGLYDMLGNVWQWCSDSYGGYYYQDSPADDPQGPPADSNRVFRGGSWSSMPDQCRCACRANALARNSSCDIGFRVVREP